MAPTNPWDPETPPDQQRRGALYGRVELPGLDLSNTPVELLILDETGKRAEGVGELGVVVTRTGDDPLPAGLDEERGIGGAFEVEVEPGDYSVSFDPLRNGLVLFDAVESARVRVQAGERVRVPLRAARLPEGSFEGVIRGEVAGALPGRPFLVHVIPVAVEGGARQQLLSGDGAFSFGQLAPGLAYRVRVEGEGYAPVQTPEFILGDGSAAFLEPGSTCGTNGVCDVGTLRMRTLGQLFDVDYAQLNDGARHPSERPYARSATVPVALVARQLLLDDGSAPYDTIQMRAMSEAAFLALAPEDPQRWEDVVAFDDDFTVDVDILEGAAPGAADGAYGIVAQLRVCSTSACDVDVVESPTALLDVVLDRRVPDVVEVLYAGRADGAVTATCDDFGASCPPADGSPWSGAVEASLFDGAGRVTGWAVTLDDEAEPATYDVVDSSPGLAVLAGLAPGVAPADGTRTMRLWARDAAGNAGVVHTRDVVVDVTPPALAATPLLVNGAAPPSGSPAPVSSTQLELALALDAPEHVVVRASLTADPSAATPFSLPADGLSFPLSLPDVDGAYTVRALVADALGNPAPLVEVDVLLSRRGAIAGAVTLEGAAAPELGGVTVTACNDADLRALTDGAGAYRIDGVPAGPCSLRLELPGYETQARDVVVPVAATLNAIPVELQRLRGDVRGRVLLEGMSDHSGAVVDLLGSGGQPVASATTDAAGDWSLRVPVGNYEGARASAPRYGAKTDGATITVASTGAATVPTMTLTMTSNDVTGVATLFGRTSHDGVEVALTGALGTATEGVTRVATTSATGGFALVEIPLGEYAATYRYTLAEGWEAPVRAVLVGPGALVSLPAVQLRERFVVIDQDAPVTADTAVTLTIGASDCFEMRYGAAPDVSDGTFAACAGSVPYTLPGPDGVNVVYAQFMDSSGALSEIVNDSIVLDRTAVIGSFIHDGGGATLSRNDVLHLRLDAGESGGAATADIAGYASGLMLFDDGSQGDAVAGDGVYELDYALRLSTDVVDAVVTGRFTDAAGNVAASVVAAGGVTVAVPPVVVELTVEPDTATGTAMVRIGTDETTTARLDWGTDAFYGNSETSAVAGTAHEVTLAGLVAVQPYHYRAVVTDLAGNQTVTVDRVFYLRPDAPGRVVALPGDGRFDLRWDAPAQENVLGYRVYRGTTAGGPYDELTTTLHQSAGIAYHDTAVQNGTSYFYVVTAVDSFGNESDASAEVSGTPAASSGPSSVTGAIGGLTVWTTSGSPYVLEANVAVAEGALLVIGPGVRVEVAGSYFLRVDGELITVGDTGAEVVFTSGLATPAVGDWVGLRFAATSPPASVEPEAGVYRGGNLLYRTVVEKAAASGVHVDGTTVAVVESTLRDNTCSQGAPLPCSGGGASVPYGTGATLLVVGGVVTGNTFTNGSNAAGGVGSWGALWMHDTLVEGNDCSPAGEFSNVSMCAGGVWAFGGARLDSVEVRANTVSGQEGAGGVMLQYGGVLRHAVIEQNLAVEAPMHPAMRMAGGVTCMVGACTVYDTVVRANSSEGNEAAGGVVLSDGTHTLIGTTVEGNSVTSGSGAGGVHVANFGTFLARQSVVSRNTLAGTGAGGVLVNDGQLDLVGVELDANVLTGGTGAHAISVTRLGSHDPMSAPVARIRSSWVTGAPASALPVVSGIADLSYTTFRGNLVTADLVVVTGDAAFASCTVLDTAPAIVLSNANAFEVGPLDATGTYWGGATTTEMDTKGDNDDIAAIHDFFDDIALARVDYAGWAASALPSAAVTAPLWGDAFGEGEAVTLSASAEDPEDGALSGASLAWSSDLDGPIGTGVTLVTSTLTVGTHLVTLTATDAEGGEAIAEVKVVIVP